MDERDDEQDERNDGGAGVGERMCLSLLSSEGELVSEDVSRYSCTQTSTATKRRVTPSSITQHLTQHVKRNIIQPNQQLTLRNMLVNTSCSPSHEVLPVLTSPPLSSYSFDCSRDAFSRHTGRPHAQLQTPARAVQSIHVMYKTIDASPVNW